MADFVPFSTLFPTRPRPYVAGSGIRVLVTGGRTFDDYQCVKQALDSLLHDFDITAIIHGDAPGADRMAGRWAEVRDIKVIACPADWLRDGKAAGPLRNTAMLEFAPDIVVAFPGGRGTADMVAKARAKRIPVYEPRAS